MGAEEYELLVSTLNKLPILKEKLTSKTGEFRLKSHGLTDLKAEVNSLQKDLETRDSEIGKIDFEVEEIDSQVKKLDLEITDLKDSITIEEKKVEPYIQARTSAVKRVNNATKSWWNEAEYRIMTFCLIGWVIIFYRMDLLLNDPSTNDDVCLGAFCLAIIWPIALMILYESNFNVDGISYITKSAIRKEVEVENELREARAALDGFKSKIGNKKKKMKSLYYQVRIHKTEKERLIVVDKKLKERSQALYDLEKSVSACSKAIGSLEKEIGDGQNAIAPLIPYSNLLLDDRFP